MEERSSKSASFPKHVLRRLFYIVPTVFVCLLFLPVNTWARGPLTKAEVIDILRTSEPSILKEFVIKHRARLYGVEFPMTQDTEHELRDAGASEGLLSALRALAPSPPPPPKPRPLVEGTYELEDIQISLNQHTFPKGALVLSKLSEDEFRFEINFDNNRYKYQGRFKLSADLWEGTIESYSEPGETEPASQHFYLCYAEAYSDNSLTVVINGEILNWWK
ncbi:MAG TPA: hypothetical protein VGR47_21980 [Terracidiphilus sp.]|nr:hypothetical protein [Terracidiphilus sp.]